MDNEHVVRFYFTELVLYSEYLTWGGTFKDL